MSRTPFGLSKENGQLVGIDEVKNGLKCDCICPSCKMVLQARHGDEREHHFKHHSTKTKDGSKIDCEYSYWVSVRSMAKQLIEMSKYLNIDLPNNTLHSNSPDSKIIIYNVNSAPTNTPYPFDLEVISSIGKIYIYFLTNFEDDTGRARTHFYDKGMYFLDTLILEIDLIKMQQSNNNARSFLEELLFVHTHNKEFVTPWERFFVNQELHEDVIGIDNNKKKDISSFLEIQNNEISHECTMHQANLYIRAMLDIPNNDEDYNDSILTTIKDMKSFYNEGMNLSKKINHNIHARIFDIFYRRNSHFYFASYSGTYYGVVYLEEKYLIYSMIDKSINILCDAPHIEACQAVIDTYYIDLHTAL